MDIPSMDEVQPYRIQCLAWERHPHPIATINGLYRAEDLEKTPKWWENLCSIAH